MRIRVRPDWVVLLRTPPDRGVADRMARVLLIGRQKAPCVELAADCPGMRLLAPDPALLDAINAAWKPAGAPHVRDWPVLLQLLKWQCLRLTSFDAVLYADLDVDLLPNSHALPHWSTPLVGWATTASVAQHWRTVLPDLLARRHKSGVRAVVSPDHHSPINCGQLLLLPDIAVYEDGLRVLRAGFHGVALGWNRSGPPAALFLNDTLLNRDGTVL